MTPDLAGVVAGLGGSMLQAALQASAVGALLLLVERALPGRVITARSGLVLLALAKFAMPAWLAWPLLPVAIGVGVAGPGAGTASREPAMAAAVLLGTWALGSTVALLHWTMLRARLATRVAEAAPCDDPRALEPWRIAARRAGLRTPPPLRLSATEPAPFAAGVLSPVVVLPAEWIGRLPARDLETVLLHEAIHVRRRDVLRLELAALLGVLWWWNPVCRLAVTRWRALVEDACDDRVLAAGAGDAAGYCGSLLRAARLATGAPGLEPAGSAGIGLHDFERRLRRIMTGGRPAPHGSNMAAALLLAAGAMLLLPYVGPARPAQARGPDSPEHAVAGRAPGAHGHRHAHDHSTPGRPATRGGRDVHVHTIPIGP